MRLGLAGAPSHETIWGGHSWSFGVNFRIYEGALRMFGLGSQPGSALVVETDTDMERLNYVHVLQRLCEQDA